MSSICNLVEINKYKKKNQACESCDVYKKNLVLSFSLEKKSVGGIFSVIF